MKQRYYFIAALLCICTTAVMGQTFNVPTAPDPNGWYHNLEKYWWYRYRLINDFLIVGPDCGMSIPAQRRETGNYWDDNGKNKLKWADATIDLGNYIAMLSTEYTHLKNNNLDCSQTLKELYYAINAFERLDNNTEAQSYNIDGSYPCGKQDNPPYANMLNGFFIRDDVPWLDDQNSGRRSLVTTYYDHFNRPGIVNILPAKGVESNSWTGRYGITQAQWGHSDKRVPVEESQDQLVQMAMGLTIAAARLNGATYNSTNLGKKAADNLFRAVNHVATYFNNWDIINPVRSKCAYGLYPDGNCNNGGAEAQDIARGAAITMQKWTNAYGYFNSSIPIVTPTNGAYNVMWQAEQFVTGIPDAGFYGTMAATSDSWIQKQGLCWGPVQLCYTTNSTYSGVQHIAEAHSWGNPHLPLVYRWLFGQSGVYKPYQYQMLFDAAPACGIHNYAWNFPGINTGYLFDWTGNDAIHEWYHKSAASGDNSDCNGLDYMALYNLYIGEDPKYQQQYFNAFYKTDLNVHIPYDRFGQTVGTSKTRLTLNYLEYLSTITKIGPGGYLTLRGAKVIDLKPGFDAQQGSAFSAYVQDYQIGCGTDIYNLGETFHHALINGQPSVYALRGTGEGNSDSSYYLDYAPDGTDFVPATMPDPVDTSTDTTVVTCEMQHQYFDELVQEVYDSGDSTLIKYMDSVIIPNATFPACDGTDGEQRKSGVVAKNRTLLLYPNPNNGQFTVSVPESDNYVVSVRDLMGREVYKDYISPTEKTKDITLSVAPGSYVAVISGSKYSLTQKIIIQ